MLEDWNEHAEFLWEISNRFNFRGISEDSESLKLCDVVKKHCRTALGWTLVGPHPKYCKEHWALSTLTNSQKVVVLKAKHCHFQAPATDSHQLQPDHHQQRGIYKQKLLCGVITQLRSLPLHSYWVCKRTEHLFCTILLTFTLNTPKVG